VAGRRLDASMTLLREVMERPLDPSYAATALAPRPNTLRRTAFTVLLAIVAGAAFSIAVSSIRQPQRQSSQVNSQLREQIKSRTAAVGKQEAANAALSAQIVTEQQNALGASGAALSAQVQQLSLEAGELPVTGPGLRITIDDAPGQETAVGADPRAATGSDDGTVLDSDLQTVVNGLWAAGAEAIDVGGHRLTALSAIREAGQAILVDFRPLVPPYVIQAVGDPSKLQSGFAAGAAGAYVQSMRDNNGIRVDIATGEHLALPGAGQLVLRAAVPQGSPGSSTGSASPGSSASKSSATSKNKTSKNKTSQTDQTSKNQKKKN
jgi:uncharacterized protein YlxW (UPF0749 family)